jgi:hypothetical protein
LAHSSNATFFASLMLDAAASSNFAASSFSQMAENLEYNVWPHAAHDIALAPRAQTPLRRDFWSIIPTNR